MGRKIILFFTGLLFLLALSSVPSFAQVGVSESSAEVGIGAPDYIIPPIPDGEPGFLGQDHNYTVVFRGNGEAVISLKVVFTNKTEENLTDVELRVPQVEPRNISVYQQIRDPVCMRYGERIYDSLTRTYKQGGCIEYQDPNYYSYYGQSKYQKAEYEHEGDTIKVTLPVAIKPDKSGSFFVYFRAMGYASKTFLGAYKYTFESLKVNDDIRSLRIGINTDSDLVLKGAKGEVEYRYEEPQFAALESAGAPAKSASIDRYYNQIGSGRIYKNASDLAPLESYKVSGAYAKNRLMLYGKEIAIGLGICAFLVIITIVVIRFIFNKIHKAEEKAESKTKKKTSETPLMILASAGLGFVSSVLVSGYTVGVILLGALATSVVSYRYDSIIILFLIIISFGVYALLIFAPAVYLGVKKGIGWGILTVVLTIVWLMIFLVVAIFIFFLLEETPNTFRALPLLEKLY